MHGTASCYSHGCRRDECRLAAREYHQKYREANKGRIYWQKREYRAANRERENLRKMLWARENPSQRSRRRKRNIEYEREKQREYRNTLDVKRRERSIQQATKDAAKKHRKPWTPEEDAAILDNPQLGTTELAFLLGRTYKATQYRRQLLCGDVEHGTVARGYARGCRCGECRKAKSNYHQKRNAA